MDPEVEDFLSRHEEALAEEMDSFALVQCVAAMTGKDITPALHAEVQAKYRDSVPWYAPAGIQRQTLKAGSDLKCVVVKNRRSVEPTRRPLVFVDLGNGIQRQ